MSLEAELWREVSQHLELGESAARLLRLLCQVTPITGLELRRQEDDRLVLVGAAGALPEEEPTVRRTLSDAGVAELGRLHEAGQPTVLTFHSQVLGPLLGLTASAPHLIFLPLRTANHHRGVALLWLTPKSRTTPEILGALAATQAPLAVALENDLRLSDLARMRAALEADREALLSRLQRSGIGDTVIGALGGLRSVMERVAQVAPTDAPVLILGETGSGKEVVARAIHTQSARRSGPVVRVNCGAIPAELIDSELFGHERGSFTGATGQRKGWFERANGGTLFLDEIGELPLAAQVRLLRVLQDGSIERVGGHRTVHVDVRIVAATHRQLESMVADGRFREDLWYRVSVFPVRLPALRERPGDMAPLAAHFAARAGARLGGNHLVPTETDIALLRSYSWPGNVRELGAVIERAAILGNGKRLELKLALGATSAPPRAPSVRPPEPQSSAHQAGPSRALAQIPSTAPASPAQSDQFLTLDQAMARHMERALELCQGRIEGPHGAAQLLGINPHTLRARMRKLGVEWTTYRRADYGPSQRA